MALTMWLPIVTSTSTTAITTPAIIVPAIEFRGFITCSPSAYWYVVFIDTDSD
jgi:hypothetical protein